MEQQCLREAQRESRVAAQGQESIWLPKQPRLGWYRNPVSSTQAGAGFGEKGPQGTG